MSKEMKIFFPGGKKVDAQYKGLTIKTDQPVYAGGEGSAPAPFDLFLASIGSCGGYYVLAFCQQRGIPFEEIEVVMKIVKDKQKGMIEKILFEINLPPEFPPKYEKAVAKAVNSCTVKEHLINPPSFEVKTYMNK